MKKKWLNGLLALALCGTLALPAFAETMEEPPAPEESEVLSDNMKESTNEDHGIILDYFTLVLVDSDFETEWPVSELVNRNTASIETDHVHRMVKDKFLSEWYEKNGDQHRHWTKYSTFCPSCEIVGTISEPDEWEDHSWSKGSLNGYQSSNTVGHVAVYNYRCSVCGATKTEPESSSEPHSMKKMDYTGNNYHRGTLHYLEWTWSCTKCGYTETRWESRTCPGNNDGTGCVFPI